MQNVTQHFVHPLFVGNSTQSQRVKAAVNHPHFIPSLRSELQRIFATMDAEEQEDTPATPFDNLMCQGLFTIGREDKLRECIQEVADQRSNLTPEEQSCLLHLTYMAIAQIGKGV